MRRLYFLILLVVCGLGATAQPYNNEWIDPAKTYYKFPIRTSQLCRIPRATLVTYGLGDVPAEQFQLWRNGQEVPMYTTQPMGPLAADGFLEFFGKQNDGLPDTVLYSDPSFQPGLKRNLFNDTSIYFLTVNNGVNARLISTPNTVATTTLPADSFFYYSQEPIVPNLYNEGFAVTPDFTSSRPFTGTPIRLSVYDQGEGFYYSDFGKKTSINIPVNNMRIYPKSSMIQLNYKASGIKSWTRNVEVYMNDSLIGSTPIEGYEMISPTFTNIPLSRTTANNSTNIKFVINNDDVFDNDPDRAILHTFSLSYRRSFNFNSLTYFEFELLANNNGNHLRIGNFRNESYPAVLYDLTNRKRYLGVTKSDSSLYYIEPSAMNRSMVILSQNPGRLKQISSMEEVHFIDFSNPTNQSDYIIISSKLLYDYNGHNYVEDYRAYRNSQLGGSYNAKVYDIEILADQFAFGSRKNPLAIKNFARYAYGHFSDVPKYILLIGHGSRFLNYRASSYANRDLLNAVPTFGMPGSDNLLFSESNQSPIPLIPGGRISVINGKEISDYLKKVKQFESLNNIAESTPDNKDWKKNVLQLAGGDDAYFGDTVLRSFMGQYEELIKGPSMGAKVEKFIRVNNDHFASDMKEIYNKVNSGVGIINYFGHSSASSIDFAMNNPFEYKNKDGKYPIFLTSGCRAGNVFDFNSNRLTYYGLSLSEKFTLAPESGAIAFISNSDLGIVNYLHLLNREWHRVVSNYEYGKGIGKIQQAAIKNTMAIANTDFFNRQNCEQVILLGDPAIVLNPSSKPDYTLIEKNVTIYPLNATVAEDTVLIKAKVLNIGKSIQDSVWAEVKREFPDGHEEMIAKTLLRNLYNADSFAVKVSLKGVIDEGTNYFIITIDPANQWDELSESNNVVKIPFVISQEEIRPVYPYPFSIVNNSVFLFTGSTVNAVHREQTYRIEIDTTELFNSLLLYQKDTMSLGGAISFAPPVNLLNGTVYYWRLAPIINGQPVNWKSASFQYLPGAYPGWGQSHFYQHTKSEFFRSALDMHSRQYKFGSRIQSLYILNSIYGFSGDEDNHFSITVNGTQDIRSACVGRSIIFNVFDTLTFRPWDNSVGYRFGSGPNCDYYRRLNFEFSYVGSANRKKMMDFLDSIPKGMYVTARLILDADKYEAGFPVFDSSYVKYWQRDTMIYGTGKSLYHSLKNNGFYEIDSLNDRPRTFLFAFKKDDSLNFNPQYKISDGLFDRIDRSLFPETIDSLGTITSPVFGPAKTWKEMHWMGHQYPGINPESEALVELIGIDKDSNQTLLKIFSPSQWVNDISNINAAQFPYLQLRLKTKNAVKAIPYQLDYWRLFYEPVPDGALSARDHYVFSGPILLTAKDSLKIELAFKNISKTPLAPTNAVIKIGDRNGIIGTYPLNQLKALASQDTAIISFKKETNGMSGKYYALIEVNKEQNPLEQFTFNNSTYLPFEVVTSLPTSVINFNAIAENNNSSLLTWNVTNEQDVKTYVLEHGTTTSNLTFLKEMAAKNINTTSNYSWVHTKPVIGVNYYRLKTIYTSGNIEYAPIRKVVFSKNGSINIYPNPFRDKIWVTVTGNKQWNMELYNASGQIIMTKKGAGNQSINTQSLPAGLYLARISCDGDIQSMKLEKHSQ